MINDEFKMKRHHLTRNLLRINFTLLNNKFNRGNSMFYEQYEMNRHAIKIKLLVIDKKLPLVNNVKDEL